MSKKDINKDKQRYGKELKAELKKVTWPTFKELVNSTSAVIAIVLVVALIVFVLDVCFENLNKFGVEGLKSIVSSNSETGENEKTEDGNLDDGIELVTDGGDGQNAADTTTPEGQQASPEVTTPESTTAETENATQEVTQ